MRVRNVCAALLAPLLLAPPARACPLCDSDLGRRVRADVFGPDFGANLSLTVLPFAAVFGLVALIHFWPSRGAGARSQGSP